MKNYLIEDKKIISAARAKRAFAAGSVSPDENLRTIVRRAVKSVAVPAELEMKLWNSLRETIINKV